MTAKRGIIVLVLLALATACLALATAWVEVAPGEVVVVRRLGRVLPAPWMPGPHLGLPFGFDRHARVRTDLVRRLEVGLATAPGALDDPASDSASAFAPRRHALDDPASGEYLTGDLNLIRARGVVQYRVADPTAFVLQTAELEPLLARLAESSLARTLSLRGIDAALRLERAAIARDVESELVRCVAAARLGIAILGVSLTDARPPSEVAADFAAAQAAQSERDRRVNDARTFAATTGTAAHAEAQARLDRARAAADRAVVLARGRAGRFLALLTEAQRDRTLTIRRLYLDMLRELLPRVRRKLVLTPEEAVDLSILGDR
jgi:membrane protease subunit HflK